MNEWDINLGDWRDSKSYGSKIQDFIEEYPEWVVYLRRDTRFKCPLHFDEATETYKSFSYTDCFCMGLGVAVSGSIVPCKISRGRNAEIRTLQNDESREVPGYIDYTQDVIHLPRAVYPKAGDIVMTCEWTSHPQRISSFPKGRPIRVHSIYVIKQVNSYFQREVGYYSCGSDSLQIQYDLLDSSLLTRLGNLPFLNVQETWKNSQYWTS